MSFIAKNVPFKANIVQQTPAPIPHGKQFIDDILPTWSDLSVPRVRDLKSAITCTARAFGMPVENLNLECKQLNALFKQQPVLALRIHPNVIYRVRSILRRLSGDDKVRAITPLTSEWKLLLEGLPTAGRRHSLITFARYCSKGEVPPEMANSSTLAAFEAALRTETLCKDPAQKARQVLATWNWARKTQPGWPAVEFTRPGMRVPYTLPLASYPSSFSEDAEKFLAGLAGTDFDQIFPDGVDQITEYDAPGSKRRSRGRGRSGSVKHSTICARRFQIQQAAAALVNAGHPPSTIVSLRLLVDPPENPRAIVKFFWDRSGQKKSSQAGGVTELLRQVAKFHCGLSSGVVDRIAVLARRVSPDRQATMTPKNARRLRILIEPQTRAMLLHLPAQLMKEATGQDPRHAARIAMSAVALEIQLMCPMRLGNLRMLTLNESFLRQGRDGRRLTHIHVYPEDVKNSEPILWPMPAETIKLLETYIKNFRPILAEPGNVFLFPGKDGAARSVGNVRAILCDPIKRWLKVEVNPHLLRHFAAWNYLKSYPGQYETVRRVLGHKDIQTTIRFYTGLEADFAARHFDAVVLKDRASTRREAAAGFGKNSKRRNRVPGGAK